MSVFDFLSLMALMLGLAAMPSASVALVVTRSAVFGVRNGIAVSCGIVCGDLIFATLAILGMTALAETMGALFAFLKIAGGAYLIWLGIGLLKSSGKVAFEKVDTSCKSLFASFVSGFSLTLGDVKAILFYASLFPAFIDLEALVVWDVILIILITLVTVGGVKLAYAILARKIVARFHSCIVQQKTKKITGGMMVGAGAYLISKS